MTRVRALLFTVVSCTAWLACTEGVGPSATGGSVELGIEPRFQIDPALFADAPIDRIVLTAYETGTERPVGSTDQAVSPTAPEWTLRLDIDLGDAESLRIVVDAELFSGPTVVWSGRLGPITVPSPAPALGMDVYPGSLDNLDVTSVTIEGAPPVLAEGAAQTLTAALTLLPGSTAEPVVYWASTDTSVATVTSTGASATLTAVAPGTVDIIATSGAAYDEVTIEVLEAGAVTKTWVGGDTGGSPTDWSNPANWSPPGVPGTSDAILVPFATNGPVLSADASVGSLRLGDDGSVDLGGHVLSVTNDLDAELGGVFNGNVRVTGPGTELSGLVPNLEVLSNRVLSSVLYVGGDLLLAGAELDTDAFFVSVLGTLAVSGDGARLVMTDPETSIYAEGGSVFDGASHEGFLTSGYISSGGDFTVSDRSPTGFAASGAHVVSFDDVNPQSVTFATPGPSQQRLNDVWITNSTGVSFDTDAFVAGDVTLTGRMEVPLGSKVTIAGDLTLYSLSELAVDGTLEVLGTCDNQGSAVITGDGTIPAACGEVTSVTRTWTGASSQDWSEPDNWNPVGVPGPTDGVLVPGGTPPPVLSLSTEIGHLTISGGNSVDLATFTLSVMGDVSTGFGGADNGLVHVTGPGSVLEGTFGDLRVSADRSVTSVANVYGDLTVDNVLDTSGQDVTVLGSLDVTGPNGVLRMTSPDAYVYVWGNATFNGGDHSNALTDGYFSVKGAFLATDASTGSYVSSGNHVTVFDGGESQSVTFLIPGGGSQHLNDVTVSNPTGVTFLSNVHASGDVDVYGRLNVPLGTTTTIQGVLTLYSASVLEVESGATVTAAGGCNNLGGIVLGAGEQTCGDAADAAWTGGGAGDPNDWANPNNWNPPVVPGAGERVVIPTSAYVPVLTANQSVAALQVASSMTVDLGGVYTLSVQGDVDAAGTIDNGRTEVVGPGSVLRGYFDELLVAATRSLSGTLVTAGDLLIEGRLSNGQYTTAVDGDLIVSTASGELVMTNLGGQVYVAGDAYFDGASLTGDLTDGILYLEGSLFVDQTHSPTAFQATGTDVYFLGTADQFVSFSNPDPVLNAGQSFADVYVGKSGGTMQFETSAYATGLFYAVDAVLAQAGSATLEVRGTLTLDNVSFDGLPLRLVTSQGPGTHFLSNVTFTGMDPAAVQLHLDLPGSANPLVLESPSFATEPSGGGYYIEAANPSLTQLVIQLNQPDPSDDGGYTKHPSNVTINWGP